MCMDIPKNEPDFRGCVLFCGSVESGGSIPPKSNYGRAAIARGHRDDRMGAGGGRGRDGGIGQPAGGRSVYP